MRRCHHAERQPFERLPAITAGWTRPRAYGKRREGAHNDVSDFRWKSNRDGRLEARSDRRRRRRRGGIWSADGP